MKFSRLAIVVIACCVFAVACGQTDQGTNVAPQPTKSTAAPASPTPDEFAVVRAVYAKDCAICHGETGEGKTAEIDGKKIKAPSLRTGHALKHSDADFVKQITKGGDGMPAFEKKLSPKEIEDMVRFIRKEFQGGNQP